MRRSLASLPFVIAAPLYFGAITASTGSQYFYFGIAAFLSLLVLVPNDHSRVAALTLSFVVFVQPFLSWGTGDILRHSPQMHASVQRPLPGLDDNIRITTDGLGFRTTLDNARDLADPDLRRLYILVGGSTTEQIYLDDSRTTAYLLSAHLRSSSRDFAKVVNAGVAGLRAKHHAAHVMWFNRKVPQTTPKTFLILLGLNDWNHYAGLTQSGIARVATGSLNLLGDPATYALSKAAGAFTGWIKRKASPQPFFDVIGYYAEVMGKYDSKPKVALTSSEINSALGHFEKDLRDVLTACNASPVNSCIFVSQPSGYTLANIADERYRSTIWMTPPNKDWAWSPETLVALSQAFNAKTKDVVASGACSECSFADAATAFGAQKNLFYDDCHFNNEGAQMLFEVYAVALNIVP